MSAEVPVMAEPVAQQLVEYTGEHRAAEETATATGWRQRFGQIATRAALAVGITLGGGAVVEGAHAAPAYAAEDYGDFLTGQYASDTKCAADARTLGEPMKIMDNGWGISLQVAGAGAESNTSNGEVGTLELRTSDTCGTVWGKLNTNRPNSIQSVGVMHDEGYRRSRSISHLNFLSVLETPAGLSVSPMVYARGHNTRAYIVQNGSEFGTYWEGRS